MKIFRPLQIKVKRICKDNPLPVVVDKGDYIDLRAAETVSFRAPYVGKLKKDTETKEGYHEVIFDIKTIKLGVAIGLPAGYKALLVNRSSTGKGMRISLINGYGVIDGPNPIGFVGDDDEWRFPAIAWGNTTILGPHDEALKDKEGNVIKNNEGEVLVKPVGGERFCQFEVVLSQKATFWQKFKHLFYRGIEIVEVDHLDAPNRGGGCIRVEEKGHK